MFVIKRNFDGKPAPVGVVRGGSFVLWAFYGTAQLELSDSVWIVPGTIDPLDD